MAKIVVSDRNPGSQEKRAALVKTVADALGVLVEDVVLLPDGVGVTVVEVPEDLVKARDKKDAHDKAEKEKAEKEKVEAERKATATAAKEEAAAHKAAEHPHSHAAPHAKAKE